MDNTYSNFVELWKALDILETRLRSLEEKIHFLENVEPYNPEDEDDICDEFNKTEGLWF